MISTSAARPGPLTCALFLLGTFTFAGFLHAAWLRSRWSRRLLIPLDGGARLRGRRIFGDNKTVRGFVVLVPAVGVAFASCVAMLRSFAPSAASHLWPLSVAGYGALGAWAGLGFMLGELPNSFVKRQLDVPPGEAPRARAGAIVSFVVDRVDSIIGMLIALSVVAPVSWLTWAYVLLFGPGVHLAFSLLLHRLGVKARAA